MYIYVTEQRGDVYKTGVKISTIKCQTEEVCDIYICIYIYLAVHKIMYTYIHISQIAITHTLILSYINIYIYI